MKASARDIKININMASMLKRIGETASRFPIAMLILLACCLLSAVIFDYAASGCTARFIVFAAVVSAALAAFAVYRLTKGGLTRSQVIFLITAAAFLLKLCYVLYTELGVRQHDIGTFREASISHSGFMFRLYNGEFPDSARGQYYHPPLHYIIEAGWLRLQTLLGASFETATHYVTTLTLFYSCASGYISYMIFREFGLDGKALYAAYALVSFHPAFIIAAGSYNNDTLSVTLMLFALLFLIRWWKNPTFFNIIMVALGLGLAMMAKLSAVYLAPAVAIVFLVRLIKDKGKLLNRIMQYAVFGAISVPLGTWWSFRLLLKFDKPLGYVMKLGENHAQYVGGYSLTQRLFDYSGSFRDGIYFARGPEFGDAFYEYNIPSAVLKTSVFGEWQIGKGAAVTEIAAYALFAVNIAVIAFSLFCIIRALCGKTVLKNGETVQPMLKTVILAFYAAITVTFTKFCFDFAHNCTMDFRYIVPTVVIGALFCGIYFYGETKSRARSYIVNAGICLVWVFCLSSATLYLLQGLA